MDRSAPPTRFLSKRGLRVISCTPLSYFNCWCVKLMISYDIYFIASLGQFMADHHAACPFLVD